MKKIYIILIIFSLLIPTFVFSANNKIKIRTIRDKLFLRRKINHYPEIGKDIKIKINNKKREVFGLLSQNNKKLIVLFHGNGALINDLESTAKFFYKNGFSTLLVEYPGYGLAYKYKTTEKNIYSDSSIIIKYVQEKFNYKKTQTYIFGWSLGTGVAVEMMKRKLGSKMLLIAPFTSIPDVAHKKYVPILPYFVIIDRFSNKIKARYIKNPVLIIHGTKDRMIPYDMSVKLNKIFPNSELLTIKNADHVNIFGFINNEIWEKIIIFLN